MGRQNYIKRSLLACIALCFIFLGSLAAYTYLGLQRIKRVTIPITNKELGINSQTFLKQDFEIRNIALFGIDSGRNPSDPAHSDSIIILTIDKLRNKIKLTSILRDSYVEVENHGKTKITEAYGYGGPSLAIKTLNENFNLDIKDFVTVDFFGLSKIIDSMGGVEIEIDKKDVKEINKWIKELSELQKQAPVYIEKSGSQNLTGIQAVAYARIRKTASGEFSRTLRQRKLLNQLLEKIREGGVSRFPSLIWDITPFLQTNISTTDMVSTGTSLLLSTPKSIEQQRFPMDGYCNGKRIGHTWYLTLDPDIGTTAKQLREYIYEDIEPIPKAPLF